MADTTLTDSGSGSSSGFELLFRLENPIDQQTIVYDGAANLWVNRDPVKPITLGAVQQAHSRTFTLAGIPATAKKITLMLHNVTSYGNSPYLIQLGTEHSNGYNYNNNYNSSSFAGARTFGNVVSPYGFIIYKQNYYSRMSGLITIATMGGNIWAASGAVTLGDIVSTTAGSVALNGVLNSIQITTVGGYDTFNSGSANIIWE